MDGPEMAVSWVMEMERDGGSRDSFGGMSCWLKMSKMISQLDVRRCAWKTSWLVWR